MNTFKNIILVLPILFIGCGEDPPFVECDWANVSAPYSDGSGSYTIHYYTGAEPEESIDDDSSLNKCIYIHYYEVGNYMIYALEHSQFEDEIRNYTIDLDDAVDFEYEEK